GSMRRLSLKSTLFGVDPKLPTKRQFWWFSGGRAFRRKWLKYWHRIPASRVDTGFGAKCRNKKAASV
nr:hypothetical protein [Opitutae bacterium KCR 482]